MWYITNNRQIRSSCLTKSMATVQVIHISMLCCHILHPNNCAAVLSHFRSTLKQQLYADKDSRCVHLRSAVRSRSRRPAHTETESLRLHVTGTEYQMICTPAIQ